MVTSRIRARYFWAMTHYLKPNHPPAYGDGSLAEISHSRVQNRPLLVSAGRKPRPLMGPDGASLCWAPESTPRRQGQSYHRMNRAGTGKGLTAQNGLSSPPSCGRFFLSENRSA